MTMRFPNLGRRIVFFAGALLLAGLPPALQAQDPPRTAADSLRAEVARLRAELDSIKAMLQRGQATPVEEEDALARLRAAARGAVQRSSAPDTAGTGEQEFVGRARSLQALNPEISVTGDIFGVLQSGNAEEDNFVPREFEFALQSALDPFSRAKVFLTAEQEGGRIEVFQGGGAGEGGDEGEHGVGLVMEEGFVEWGNLPGGFGLKAGRFYQQLGQLNRWHSHALPFQSRSLPHLVFVGEEALIQDGISVRWLLPTATGAGAYEITLEGTRSRNETLFGESKAPSLLGHFNAFWQTSEATDLELGISAIVGEHLDAMTDEVFDNRLFNAEMAFNWAPPSQSRYRGFMLRAGAMLSDPAAIEGEADPKSARGVWALAEVKLNREWILGGRYGWVENPADTGETALLLTPAITYWQSEFVRLRAEYDVIRSRGETSGIFTLRVTFAMGPHKHENY